MPIAFGTFTALIAASPVLLINMGPANWAVVQLIAALLLVLSIFRSFPTDLALIGDTLFRLGFLIALPGLWILVQLLPLPLASPLHSIWTSTAAALGTVSSGHLTVDVVETFASLLAYATWVALLISAAIITADRHRAELTILVLAGVASLCGIILALNGRLPPWASFAARSVEGQAFKLIVTLGSILAIAVIAGAIESRESVVGSDNAQKGNRRLANIVFGLVTFLICTVSLVLQLEKRPLIGLLLGVFAFALTLLLRRMKPIVQPRAWMMAIFASAAIFLIVAQGLEKAGASGLLTFAVSLPPDVSRMSQRMLQDATWLGSGAGTFDTLARVYQEAGSTALAQAPSSMIKLVVEWGKAAATLANILAIALAAMIYRGAISRGRDSAYPAAAIGCIVVLGFEAYSGAALVSLPICLWSAAVIGLGVAQMTSRSARNA